MNKALIIVDYQYDFVNPSGSLYINGAEKIEEKIINYISEKKSEGYLIIFIKDWHTENHVSFETWPAHCIANTDGAKTIISEEEANFVIHKGNHQFADSYSGFYEAPGIKTHLDSILKENNVNYVELCGVALDVCVKSTYDDAIEFGYETRVILDLTKSIDENYIWED